MTAKEIEDKWTATINSILEVYKDASEARRYADNNGLYVQLNTICRDCVYCLMEVEHIAR